MAIAEDIARLADEVREVAWASKTEVSTFPSGAASLDVWVGPRLFVLAYLPSSEMFGVDEVRDGDGFGTGYRFGFKNFDSARAKLLNLLNEASRSPAQHQS